MLMTLVPTYIHHTGMLQVLYNVVMADTNIQ